MNFAHIGPHTKLPSRSRFIDPDRIWIGDYVFMEENVSFDTANQIFNEQPERIRIRIGDRVTIGRHVQISAVNRVEIGNNVLFAQNVYVADNDHHYSDIGIPIRDQYFSGYDGHVLIEDDCWLGRNAVVIGSNSGITIGRGSVIGANAVCTFDVPAYAVVAGNPGRIVKLYDPEPDEFVRVRDRSDIERVLRNRERLGIKPRPVRVDLGRFHHLVEPMPIEGASGTCLGLLAEPDGGPGWQAWLQAYVAAFPDGAPATLVIGVPEAAPTAWLPEVIQRCSALVPTPGGPSVVLQSFDEASRPAFLRRLHAVAVEAAEPNAERQTLQALAAGVAVLGTPCGRVARWLRDHTTGLAGEDRVLLLQRALREASALPSLGHTGRNLLERTFGVPHVQVAPQVMLYTTPSDRLGL